MVGNMQEAGLLSVEEWTLYDRTPYRYLVALPTISPLFLCLRE
jgi:hypothetical protein